MTGGSSRSIISYISSNIYLWTISKPMAVTHSTEIKELEIQYTSPSNGPISPVAVSLAWKEEYPNIPN